MEGCKIEFWNNSQLVMKLFFKIKANLRSLIFITGLSFILTNCSSSKNIKMEVFETSANGNALTKVTSFNSSKNPLVITIKPE